MKIKQTNSLLKKEVINLIKIHEFFMKKKNKKNIWCDTNKQTNK